MRASLTGVLTPSHANHVYFIVILQSCRLLLTNDEALVLDG